MPLGSRIRYRRRSRRHDLCRPNQTAFLACTTSACHLALADTGSSPRPANRYPKLKHLVRVQNRHFIRATTTTAMLRQNLNATQTRNWRLLPAMHGADAGNSPIR